MKTIKAPKPVLVILTPVLAVSLVFTGCGTNTDSGSSISGTVTVSGSTSVQPLAQVFADAFMDKNPNITVDIQAGGSSTGIKNVSSGAADIGTASRELKEAEKAWGLDEHIIAVDGMAIIVNPANRIEDFTLEQVQKIFKGEITNWKELGGADAEIVVVSREEGSGTRGAFEELTGLLGNDGASLVKATIIANENGAVKANVASKENAVGYISLGYVDETVKAAKLNSIEANTENIKNKSYPLWRPFLMVTKGEPAPWVQAFLDYVLGPEGQSIVVKEGYISTDILK